MGQYNYTSSQRAKHAKLYKSTEKLAEIKTNQVRKVYILIICFLNTETSIGARSGLPGDVINGDVTSDTSSLHRLDDDLETEHDVPNDSPLTQESSDYGTIFEQTQKEPSKITEVLTAGSNQLSYCLPALTN